MDSIDHQIDPLSGGLQKTIEDFDKLALNAETQIESLSNEIENILAGFSGIVSEDSPLIVRLEDTLQDISAMAGSFRQLADYLEQHPEALIQGKGENGGK